MGYRLLICICVLLYASSGAVVGQTYTTIQNASPKLLTCYSKAVELRRADKPTRGLKKLDKAIKTAPDFIDAHIERARCLAAMDDLIGSRKAIETAVAIDSFYDARNLWTLGRLYFDEGEFKKAQNMFNSYRRIPDLRVDQIKRVDEMLFRVNMLSDKDGIPNIGLKPIAGNVNTEANEALPALTVDGQMMIFTRFVRGQEDLYMAKWNATSESWLDVQILAGVNSSQYNEGAHAISADGQTLVFTGCNRPDGLGACDLYFTTMINGRWQRPANMESINTKAWDGHPSLSADGRGLYFSSNRPGGLGQRDIWYTHRLHDNTWSVPVNLGMPVNGDGHDESPFVHFDGTTLYFMSTSHPGLGEADLFKSNKIGTKWDTPQNLGAPINTPSREGALSVHPNGQEAFFTSNRTPGHHHDIYSFMLPEHLKPASVSFVDGSVIDAVTGLPVEADVIIYAVGSPDETFHYNADYKGHFISTLPHGKQYGVVVEHAGYIFYSHTFLIDNSEKYKPYPLEISLQPIVRDTAEGGEASKPVVLRNVHFETGSAQLRESSFTELTRLEQLLQKNPEIRIDILGHTDNVGSPESNQILSENRANAVYHWLVTKGIEAGRLSFYGHGETKPIASNSTEEGRALNRRTEFIVH